MERQPILLVEDNDDDVFIFRRTLKKAEIADPVNVAMDGQAAIDYLGGRGIYQDRERFPFPGIVFLDLKMPYKTGLEVLEWARSQVFQKRPRIFVLTSSAEERDVRAAREFGAEAYLLKPPKAEALRAILLPTVPAKEIPEDLFRSSGTP